MITKQNITEILRSFPNGEVENCLNDSNEYILLQMHIFNVGASFTIESVEYNEDAFDEANGNGNLYCDKDQFCELLRELGLLREILTLS